jgi:hypothetical protein
MSKYLGKGQGLVSVLVQTKFVLYLFGDGSVGKALFTGRKASVTRCLPEDARVQKMFKKCIFSHFV